MIFEYGDKELNYLKSKDKKLREVIDKVGFIERKINSDVYYTLINSIISQQISTNTAIKIFSKLKTLAGNIDPESIARLSEEEIKSIGISLRKAKNIKNITNKVINKKLDLNSLKFLDDDKIKEELTRLDGIGEWTAEMIMIFCLNRMNVLSYNDAGIKNGICLLYNHKKINKKLFMKYKKRYTPYSSVASLYLWKYSNTKGLSNEIVVNED